MQRYLTRYCPARRFSPPPSLLASGAPCADVLSPSSSCWPCAWPLVAVDSVAPVPGRPTDAAATTPADRGPWPQRPPGRQVADELDLTTVVPALQKAFGDRYGGFWIEPERSRDRMHVAVVDATAEDAAVVARLTGGHRRVLTDAVGFGYDELRAAEDEIARSLDRGAGNFTVSTDVVTNSVVVRTAEQDPAAVAAPAADRRGSAAPPPSPTRRRAPRPHRSRRPSLRHSRDVAQAVVVESDPTIGPRTDGGPVGLVGLRVGAVGHDGEPLGLVRVHVGLLLPPLVLRVLRQHRRSLWPRRRVGRRRQLVDRRDPGVNRYDGVWWVEGDVALYSLTGEGPPGLAHDPRQLADRAGRQVPQQPGRPRPVPLLRGRRQRLGQLRHRRPLERVAVLRRRRARVLLLVHQLPRARPATAAGRCTTATRATHPWRRAWCRRRWSWAVSGSCASAWSRACNGPRGWTSSPGEPGRAGPDRRVHAPAGTRASRSSEISSSRRRTSEASVGSSPKARSTSTSVARPMTIE